MSAQDQAGQQLAGSHAAHMLLACSVAAAAANVTAQEAPCMSGSMSRRRFVGSVPAVPFLISAQPASPATVPPWAGFPAHEPEAAKEIVGASHGNLARVKELVGARPALARASWDWGYGDWETPIDAASHVGNRPIAEYLIANGARPTIFTAAKIG